MKKKRMLLSIPILLGLILDDDTRRPYLPLDREGLKDKIELLVDLYEVRTG